MGSSDFRSKERFSGLSETYAKHRPTYPPDAIDFIVQHCHWGPGNLIVDVGCGTGISSRLLAERGFNVLGLEPNADMRQKAEQTPTAPGARPPVYRSDAAEAIGLADEQAAGIVSAQAFHWFATPNVLAEFHRVLMPGGWVVLIWNERDDADPFTKAFSEVIRTSNEAYRTESMRQQSADVFMSNDLFETKERNCFHHSQSMNESEMLGRAFSSSYAPKTDPLKQAWIDGFKRVFQDFQVEGQVALAYETSVYTGQKPIGAQSGAASNLS